MNRILNNLKYKFLKLKRSTKPIKLIFDYLSQKFIYLLPIPSKPFEKVKIFELYQLPENRKNKKLVLFAHYSPKSDQKKYFKFY